MIKFNDSRTVGHVAGYYDDKNIAYGNLANGKPQVPVKSGDWTRRTNKHNGVRYNYYPNRNTLHRWNNLKIKA